MRRNRNAKIIATLGPATSSREALEAIFEAGADVFRMNFSHGSHEEHRKRYETIRVVEKEFGRPIAVMMDLQGPKLRVGDFEGGSVHLDDGASFRLQLEEVMGTATCATLPHPEIFAALEAGMDLLLDDGRIRLEVISAGKDHAETRVVVGGDLSNHKGVNVPSAMLDLSALTEKDREDLAFGLELGVDWVALSFVQRAKDVQEVKDIVDGRAAVIAKLEKPQAIDHLEDIVETTDAVMVARGDLGVELPPEDVPAIQKQIIAACRRAGKPVVVATQMLESMISSPTPTRAEASDVATAIYDGADAVMLSAETAVGDFPVDAISMMSRIIARVEIDPLYRKLMDADRRAPEATTADAISAAARQCAGTIDAAAIVTFSSSGSTTLRAARERPEVSILGLTPNERTARRLALVWGVHSVKTKDLTSFTEMVERAVMIALREDFANKGDKLVVTAGVPFGTPGATNILRITWVE